MEKPLGIAAHSFVMKNAFMVSSQRGVVRRRAREESCRPRRRNPRRSLISLISILISSQARRLLSARRWLTRGKQLALQPLRRMCPTFPSRCLISLWILSTYLARERECPPTTLTPRRILHSSITTFLQAFSRPWATLTSAVSTPGLFTNKPSDCVGSYPSQKHCG